MTAFSLMVQGTTTDAGKSILVAGICRVLANRAMKVAPFKPQNMALNSAVTADGGEIGRAQAVQADACKIKPHTDMNPVLIKPSSDTGAQIIIQGKALKDMQAADFHRYKPCVLKHVMESFHRLENQYQAVIIEGAGSPAEINLREGDIANMGFAEEANCPVILVTDIDKGGVFAHIIGTLELLSQSERNRIIGFVINKFRGDIKLLESGLQWLEKKTGKPVFGVLPYLHNFYLEAEDAIDNQHQKPNSNLALKVVVPVLPRISNHTDFDALRLHPNIDLVYVRYSELPPPCDLIILPGSKNVKQDLESLEKNGWRQALNKHLRYGGKVIGICGGYQMLSQQINDPHGIEGEAGSIEGFGFAPQTVLLRENKTLNQVTGQLTLNGETVDVTGYEIHNGVTNNTHLKSNAAPIRLNGFTEEGFLSNDNAILGSYLHGIFDSPKACDLILRWAGLTEQVDFDIQDFRNQEIERLASSILDHIEFEKLIYTAQSFKNNDSSPSKKGVAQ